jgi:osmotically inducible protein OsmC
MPIRNATAVWHGNLFEGKGDMKFGGGAFEGQYSFKSRFEEGTGTNPEELIGASMAFAATLAGNGFNPEEVQTKSNVHLDKVGDGFTITTIVLNTEARVPDIDDAKFQELAEDARKNCPVSRALAGVEIKLNAKLV